jgi:DNA-3-methyladenine glycosylase II
MTEQLGNSGGPYILLGTPKEFQYSLNLSYLARSTRECMFRITGDKVFKAIQLADEQVLIEVSCEKDDVLRVRFPGRTELPSEAVRSETASYVREWFDLDTDITPYYQLAERYPLLGKLVNQFYGLRILGIPDLFEALCWGVMGQQINLTFAYTLKSRFVESFGQHIEREQHPLWIFPAPNDIAKLSVERLMTLQLTRKKAEYLIEIAKRMAEGRLSKEGLLSHGDYKLAEKELVAIRGIGPWTANYVRMRCLRDPSAFPIADVGLHNAVQQLLGMDRKPTLEELHVLFTEWEEWAAYITFYMWRTLY